MTSHFLIQPEILVFSDLFKIRKSSIFSIDKIMNSATVKFDSSSEILALAPDMSIPSQPLTQTPSPSTQGSVKSEPSADDSD